MKILVLENVIRRTNLFGEYGKHAVSTEALKHIFAELQNLVDLERNGGIQSLKDYLNVNNGKSMKGGGEHVWKYRLDDGDRILYTWGKYLPYLQDEDKDSLVLLAYAVHDKQGQAGQKLPTEQHYEDAREILKKRELLLKKRSEFTEDDATSEEDYDAFCDIVFDAPLQANHVIYVVSDENLATLDLRNLDFKLSKKQSAIIEQYEKNPQPTLVLGGAGTGKTVLAVHFLNDFSLSKSVYFTQSRELLNSVENRYKSLCGHKDGTDPVFWDINEFCRSFLKDDRWSRKNFVETSQFLNSFVANNKSVQRVLSKHGLTPIDLWTEIRGVIKGFCQVINGSAKSDWTRTKLLNQTELAREYVEPFRELSKRGFIERNANDPRLFGLNPNYKSVDYSDLSDFATPFLDYLVEYSNSFDTTKIEISLDEYKALNEEVSMVEKSARDDVYNCYKMYKQWLEVNNYYDDNDLTLNAIEKLAECNTDHLKKFIAKNKNVQRVLKEYGLEPDELWTEIREVIRNASKTELSLEEYKKLDEADSLVNLAAREDVYGCYEAYKQWLEEKKYFDNNESVLSSANKFDFVVVDEIQDYTELQIYLISRLTNKRRIILVGDSKQIVNPTVFNERKLIDLFKDSDNGIALNIERLDQNFRCQKEVVSVANKVVKTRREKIGAQKHDVEESGVRDGEKPLCLTWNENNVKKMLGELLKYPSVALLVPNGEIRDRIIKLYGEDEYRNAQNSLIYTIAEIKGMEYRYVVSCDVLSAYDRMWQNIMNDNANRTTRYRYYFNLFYVSITRAQEFLCVMEENKNNPFYSELVSTENLLRSEDAFDARKLFLDQLRNEDTDWYADAEDNENAGNYLRALESYRKANADNEDIWRCTAKLAEKERDFEKCVKYLLILDSEDKKINRIDNLKRYMEEIEESSELRKLGSVYLQPESFYKSGLDLNIALKSIYGDSESQEFMMALNEFVKNMNSYMGSLINV